MIHAKYCKPRVFPWNSERAPEQIDRAQEIGGDLTLNRTKQYEIGRDGVLGYKKDVPSFSYTMRQFEHGSMAFWRDIANFADPASDGLDNDVTLTDMQSTKFDIAAFLTDDDATFRGTIWFPKLRLSGFSINIGDPDAIVERNFTLVGEDYKMLDGKYFSYQTQTASGATETVTLSPAAVEWASGDYIFRVLRIRAGVVSELLEDTTSTYDADSWRYTVGTVIVQTCSAGDVIKVFYPSSTAYTTTWTDNNTDDDFLTADSCEIYIKHASSTRVYRLQSVGIDVSLDRADYKEIGNDEIVQTGVKGKTVTVSLDRFAEDFALEDILAHDTTYPYIDPRDFAEDIQMMVKVFSDKTHTMFKIGYLITSLSPTSVGASQPVEDYHKRTAKLEADNIKISDDESEIVFA